MSTTTQAAKAETKVEAKRGKKPPVSLTVRVAQQLDRAVLGGKVAREDLSKLAQHITKLEAFLGE